MNFVEELKWRGMLHDMMPGTEELLAKEQVTAYIGFDPTADSLHIGHLCSVMILRHFQRCGHKPLALIGGATGMIGDPSGKSAERNLLTEETLQRNMAGMKKQLSKFLDFDSDAPNRAELVNNYDWMKDFSFLDFAREVGKHITVNYMMAKDSVKKRLNGEARDGLSFTEFTYQLLQGYDFLHLYETKGCKLQMGGSDQWGNITTGAELIRRTNGGEVFALTSPLITKADGGKFGKTESGNIWLDPRYTSPYKFYQFWLNVSDADAARYIKIFTSLSREEIEALTAEHEAAPHLRVLQKRLAKEVTIMFYLIQLEIVFVFIHCFTSYMFLPVIILFYSTITLHVFKVYYTKNTLSNRGFSQFFRLTGSFSPEISKKEAAVFLRLPDTLIWSYRF